MFDITIAITLFVAFHIATIYVCANVLRLSYPAFVAAVTVTGAVAAFLVKMLEVTWMPQLKAAMDAEQRTHELGRDALVASIIFLVGASISNTILYRRFGIGGWLGLMGVNMLVNSAF